MNRSKNCKTGHVAFNDGKRSVGVAVNKMLFSAQPRKTGMSWWMPKALYSPFFKAMVFVLNQWLDTTRPQRPSPENTILTLFRPPTSVEIMARLFGRLCLSRSHSAIRGSVRSPRLFSSINACRLAGTSLFTASARFWPNCSRLAGGKTLAISLPGFLCRLGLRSFAVSARSGSFAFSREEYAFRKKIS